MVNDTTLCCEMAGHCAFGSWTILGEVIEYRVNQTNILLYFSASHYEIDIHLRIYNYSKY